jgi:hypothetical protein
MEALDAKSCETGFSVTEIIGKTTFREADFTGLVRPADDTRD